MSDPELIRAAIAASGLSARQFAVAILARDERTIRRWASGEIVIPEQVRDWLAHWMALPDAARTRVVRTLTRPAP